MTQTTEENKPCLVETRQGLSVIYRNRYLYSAYNPQNAIEKLVSTVNILPHTLVLCFSPILGYGISLLKAKLPESSFLLIVETDESLLPLYDWNLIGEDTAFIGPRTVSQLYELLSKKNQHAENGISIPPPGSFKRCLRLDLSGSVAFSSQKYQEIHNITQLAITTFWQNRMTLVKMARLFHRNFFRNLALLPFSEKLLPQSVEKSIVVIGAGPSADETIEHIAKNPQVRNAIYIISVDAALSPLIAHNIVPDICVTLECQYAIQQAYCNSIQKKIHIVADLISRPSVLHGDTSLSPLETNCTGGTNSFFLSEFASTNFFQRLAVKKILPFIIPPLGSVGIAATKLAVYLRKNTSISIFISGLDFSFSPGKTHCTNSFPINAQLRNVTRLHPTSIGTNFYSGFYEKTQDGNTVLTTKTLMYYSAIFKDNFSQEKNLFNMAHQGLPLGIKKVSLKYFEEYIHRSQTNNIIPVAKTVAPNDYPSPETVKQLYCEEKEKLIKLRQGLTTGNLDKKQLFALLESMDYLYLHFPDGHKASLEISFLKRVRAEIDFFLKDITLGENLLDRLLQTKTSK